MLDTLNSERFVDQAPTEVYATLLDEGQYLCSVRTMYRILEEHAELRSGAISSATQTTKSRSFWRREPTRFGPGTSRSFSVP